MGAIATEGPDTPPRTAVYGHRGARGWAPENTISGFRAALAFGADGLELDVGLTKDGIVAVTHDPVLNPDITRASDGAWLPCPGPALRSLRWADLAQFDVGRIRPGSAYAARFRRQHGLDGARIPSLEEVLRLEPRTRVLIELKTDPADPHSAAPPEELADAVVRTAKTADALGRIAVMSFDWRGLHHLRRAHPAIPLAFLTDASTVRAAALWWDGVLPAEHGSVPRCVAAQGGEESATIWGPCWRGLRAEAVREARALGLRVVPWSVNAPSVMARLIGWGVDGLITDYPDIALRVLGRAS